MSDEYRTTNGNGQPSTTIIERRGSGAGIFIGLILLAALVLGGIFLLNQQANDNAKTQAVTQAADQVGDAAQSVGEAAKDATNN